MSTEENKSLARRYVEQVLNEGNLNALDDFASPNYKRYLSPTAAPLTPEVQKQRLAGLRAAFPDIHLTIDDVIAEGDRVALRMTLNGTHQGTLQGIAPTGKPVTVFAFDVIRIENGKFIEHWGGPDLLSMLQQLGAVVSAAPEKK
jgi:predicted SnoaL-like aldol condensation-catalyzing enzyme